MNNTEIRESLDSCKQELERILEITRQDRFNTANNYLTKYCIIRACGAIEQAFKGIITEFSQNSRIPQLINYIEKKIKKSSMNPSFDNMNKLLKDFDESWSTKFKNEVKTKNESIADGDLKTSLESLNNARNSFAHGGNTTVSINEVLKYFEHAVAIIEIYDNIVSIEEQVQ